MPPHEPSASWRLMIQRSAAPSENRRRAAERSPLVDVEEPVEKVEPSGPGGERAARAGSRPDVQLVDVDRELAHGSVRADHGEGDHGLTGPAREVVDVQGNRRREQHELGRHDGQALPGPLAEEGQPDPGEDPAGADPPGLTDVGRGPAHVGVIDGVAGEPERHVRLDGGREVRRAPVVGGPGAIVALTGADPRGGAGGLPLRADAEELAQEEVLGVHGDVRLQLALPPALVVLTFLERARPTVQARRGGASTRCGSSAAT